jgi:hypothetical protein
MKLIIKKNYLGVDINKKIGCVGTKSMNSKEKGLHKMHE